MWGWTHSDACMPKETIRDGERLGSSHVCATRELKNTGYYLALHENDTNLAAKRWHIKAATANATSQSIKNTRAAATAANSGPKTRRAAAQSDGPKAPTPRAPAKKNEVNLKALVLQQQKDAQKKAQQAKDEELGGPLDGDDLDGPLDKNPDALLFKDTFEGGGSDDEHRQSQRRGNKDNNNNNNDPAGVVAGQDNDTDDMDVDLLLNQNMDILQDLVKDYKGEEDMLDVFAQVLASVDTQHELVQFATLAVVLLLIAWLKPGNGLRVLKMSTSPGQVVPGSVAWVLVGLKGLPVTRVYPWETDTRIRR
ncbi:hypothetical protein BDP27DRAFT_1370870 [Rhodocollybia butyracea]|uniref:Uncharacterized protein n=1 Tax=Rhodocollybia butyracea TaxID=206335 RepID=A0A9P5U029_9AGAR|nr:hypothetical protein BDP27DRAFT_1370870 [Rhodocollybia butyracea]